MAGNIYDVRHLLDQVYRMESVAVSSQTFNEEDVIEFLNTELQTELVPLIQTANEEYGVMSIDTPISALQNSIRIPGVATGARLRSVQLISPNGLISNLPRLNPDKLQNLGVWMTGFYIKNNELVFYPQAPTGDGTLRLNYFRRPNKLVPENETGRVLVVDTLSNTVSLDNSPVGVGWFPGCLVDIIVGESPFDFRVVKATVVDVTGAVVELDSATIAQVEVGDYIALAGCSPVAMFIPAEATGLLCQLAAARCLQSLGDTEGYKIAAVKAQQMKEYLLNLISDRIEGQPQRLSSIGMGRGRRWNWYWAT